MLQLAACGGGGSADGSQPQGIYASVRGWLDLRTNRVSLTWSDVVPAATRYQIEQQDHNGAWVAIDGVWATHGQPQGALDYQYPGWQGIITTPTTLRVEAVTPSSLVPLQTLVEFYSGSGSAASLTFAPPASVPSIELDQPEPLESPTHVTLGNTSTSLWGVFTADEIPSPSAQGAQPALTLDPGTLTSGTHVIYAMFSAPQSPVSYLISRSVRAQNSQLAIEPIETVQSEYAFDDYLLATSDAGVASLVMNINDVPVDTVTAPNACVPRPCAAGQPFNGYRLSINTRNLAATTQTFTVEATDNAGNTVSYPGYFNHSTAATAALDSPADGAVVSGTLHISGTFAAPTPGALEVMVTLGGILAYDKTVANTGATIPFTGDISLAGVAPGYHTLGVYARVGNTPYAAAASIIVQVVAAP